MKYQYPLKSHQEKLINHSCSNSPLFLSTVLSEMCTIGFHRKFQAQLDELLLSNNLSSLFQNVLNRWEVLFYTFLYLVNVIQESFGKDLTQTVLLLVFVSRFGVKESAVQQITAG